MNLKSCIGLVLTVLGVGSAFGQAPNPHPEKFQAYSGVKQWVGQITYRRQVDSHYKLGDAYCNNHEVQAGTIKVSLDLQGLAGEQGATWVTERGTEHASYAVDGTIDVPGASTRSFRNDAGDFQEVNGEVGLDYFRGTYRVQGAGGTIREVKETHILRSRFGTTTEVVDQNFAAGTGYAEAIPLPIPKPGQGLALIGGKTWTEPKQVPPGLPPEAAAPILGTTDTRQVFWTLVPAVEEVELVVDIDDYEKWIPKGDKNETVAGGHLNVSASLEARGGGGTTKKCDWIKFELLGTSREPGVCLNWPQHPRPPQYDLQFAAKQPQQVLFDDADPLRQGDAQVVQTVGNQVDHARAVIDCYDYGAWSILRVTAQLEDQRIVVGHLRGQPQNIHITLPRRQDGSLIAQAWKEGRRGADVSDAADAEHIDGNDWDGDGFSLYEEYRGVFMNGIHRRLDPSRKELCVLDKIKGPTIRGFRWFNEASHVKVLHEFRNEEFRNDRVLNFNRTHYSPRSTSEFQHGIIVKKGKTNAASYTFPEEGWSGGLVPKHVDRIEMAPGVVTHPIDMMQIFGVWVLEDSMADLAHEMAHACGVNHHGESDLYHVKWTRDESVTPHRILEQPVSTPWGPVVNPPPPRPVHIYYDGGGEISPDASVFNFAVERYLANYKECQHSGDVDCLMRYSGCDAYVHPLYPADGRVLLMDVEPHGRQFCRSPAGTQFNDPGRKPWPRHGDCAPDRGNCFGGICVNDSLRP